MPSASPPDGSSPAGALQPAFEKLRAAAVGLPEIVEATSYGTPSLTVRKKFLSRVKDADTVVVMCPVEEKEVLIEAAPDTVELAYKPGGRPYLRGLDQIDISLSHTETLLLVGLTRRGWIGVDAELRDRPMLGLGTETFDQGFQVTSVRALVGTTRGF